MTLQTEEENQRIHIDVGAPPNHRSIACLHFKPAEEAAETTLVWLGGYRSDMSGTKAVELDAAARALGVACLRFDYSGHGASGGEFKDGTISRWVEEALAVIDRLVAGRLILVGSSMGGWIALRVIQQLRAQGQGDRLAGLVLIAPAPDFITDLVEPNMTQAERDQLAEKGYFEQPSDYGPETSIFTKALMEDGHKNRVLTGVIEVGCPVHILQGMCDTDVPYIHALKIMEHLISDDVVMTLIRDGDHRLSRPEDLVRLTEAVSAMVGTKNLAGF